MSEKRKNIDFFNLDWDEESDNEQKEKIKQDLVEKKVQKWDWDRPENFNMYFKFNKNYSEKNIEKIKKPTLVSGYDENSSDDDSLHLNSKKIRKIESNPVQNKFKVLKIEKESLLKYELTGHSGSVNRINWRHKHADATLLSSSIDG
jgi:hypothetical protein